MANIKGVFYFLFALFMGLVYSQTKNITDYRQESYCFHFTWIGPSFAPDNETIKTITCNDISPSPRSAPCVYPLIVTDNFNNPNTRLMWEGNKDVDPDLIGCKLTKDNSCIRYRYSYNNANVNATYFCSKVTTVTDNVSSPATSGCYTENKNGYDVEVCVCRSSKGAMPCNSASLNKIFGGLLVFALVLIFWRITNISSHRFR